jgi:hypothetical protein
LLCWLSTTVLTFCLTCFFFFLFFFSFFFFQCRSRTRLEQQRLECFRVPGVLNSGPLVPVGGEEMATGAAYRDEIFVFNTETGKVRKRILPRLPWSSVNAEMLRMVPCGEKMGMVAVSYSSSSVVLVNCLQTGGKKLTALSSLNGQWRSPHGFFGSDTHLIYDSGMEYSILATTLNIGVHIRN